MYIKPGIATMHGTLEKTIPTGNLEKYDSIQ